MAKCKLSHREVTVYHFLYFVYATVLRYCAELSENEISYFLTDSKSRKSCFISSIDNSGVGYGVYHRDLVSSMQTHGGATRDSSHVTIIVTSNYCMSVFPQFKCTVIGGDVGMHEEHVGPVVWWGEDAGRCTETVADVDDDVTEGNDGTARSRDVGFVRHPRREHDSMAVFFCNNRTSAWSMR